MVCLVVLWLFIITAEFILNKCISFSVGSAGIVINNVSNIYLSFAQQPLNSLNRLVP